jgi:hypothetical protein
MASKTRRLTDVDHAHAWADRVGFKWPPEFTNAARGWVRYDGKILYCDGAVGDFSACPTVSFAGVVKP